MGDRPAVTPASPPTPPDSSQLSRERMLLLILVGITFAVLALAVSLLAPFVPALTWAVVLAVVVHPLHDWMLRCVGRPWLAAMLSVVIVTIVVAVPGFFVGRALAKQVLEGADTVRDFIEGERWRELLDRFPQLGPLRRWIEQVASGDELGRLSEMISKTAGSLAGQSFGFVLGAFVTLFLLFYFLRDRRRMIDAVFRFVPMAPPEADRVLVKVRDTIQAIVFGTLAVALAQGALGGLMFWWLGLPAPLLWGTVMALLAILPILGAAIVWVPAAVYLAATGQWQQAVLLTAWGGIVVSLIDNLVYPVLVKDKMRLHTVPVFIAVLGGLAVFGSTGVVLGPLVLALTMALLDVWRQRFALGEVESGVNRTS